MKVKLNSSNKFQSNFEGTNLNFSQKNFEPQLYQSMLFALYTWVRTLYLQAQLLQSYYLFDTQLTIFLWKGFGLDAIQHFSATTYCTQQLQNPNLHMVMLYFCKRLKNMILLVCKIKQQYLLQLLFQQLVNYECFINRIEVYQSTLQSGFFSIFV